MNIGMHSETWAIAIVALIVGSLLIVLSRRNKKWNWAAAGVLALLLAVGTLVTGWARWPKQTAERFILLVSQSKYDEARESLSRPQQLEVSDDGALDIRAEDGTKIRLAPDELPLVAGGRKAPESLGFLPDVVVAQKTFLIAASKKRSRFVHCLAERGMVRIRHIEPPVPGCRVERVDVAEQAVSQLTRSDAYVFKIDGDLATCKFEILYRPDENSEEELLYYVNGDVVAQDAQIMGITKHHDNHLFLAIQVPKYPPKPNDEIVFYYSITGTSVRDSKKAEEIFPDSLLAYDGPSFSSHSPMKECHLEPGEAAIVADYQHSWKGRGESGEGAMSKRDIVRYRVTVTCLDDGKLPDRSGGDDDEGKDEEPK